MSDKAGIRYDRICKEPGCSRYAGFSWLSTDFCFLHAVEQKLGPSPTHWGIEQLGKQLGLKAFSRVTIDGVWEAEREQKDASIYRNPERVTEDDRIHSVTNTRHSSSGDTVGGRALRYTAPTRSAITRAERRTFWGTIVEDNNHKSW